MLIVFFTFFKVAPNLLIISSNSPYSCSFSCSSFLIAPKLIFLCRISAIDYLIALNLCSISDKCLIRSCLILFGFSSEVYAFLCQSRNEPSSTTSNIVLRDFVCNELCNSTDCKLVKSFSKSFKYSSCSMICWSPSSRICFVVWILCGANV